MPQFGDSEQFPTDTPVPASRASSPEPQRSAEGYQGLLQQVVQAVHQRTGDVPPGDEVGRARLRPTVEQAARSLGPMPPSVTPEQLTRDALAELAGYGVFESILEDATVTSAVIDSTGHVSVGRGGAPTPGGPCFSSADAAAACMRRLLSAHGVSHEGSSFVRASLSDGTRITAAFAPIAVGLAALIERPSARSSGLVDLAGAGVLQANAAQHLAQSVAARRSVVVVGACPSARAVLVGALVAAVPPRERLVTVTSAGGLGAGRDGVVALCADGRWSEVVSMARAMMASRCAFGELNVETARAFVGGLTNGADGWILSVDAPNAVIGVSRIVASATQDQWLSRDEVLGCLAAGRGLLVETARDAEGAPRVTGLYEIGHGGSLQRLDG